jgi:hypothetical protein
VLQPFPWVQRRSQTALPHFVLIIVKTRMEKYTAHGLHRTVVQRAYTKQWYGFKPDKKIFLIQHRHNIHCQQRELSKFLTRSRVRFSCLLQGCGTSFQDGVAAEEGFLCAPFEVSRSVITVSVNFVHGLKKTHSTRITSLLNLARNSSCNAITDLDTSKPYIYISLVLAFFVYKCT